MQQLFPADGLLFAERTETITDADESTLGPAVEHAVQSMDAPPLTMPTIAPDADPADSWCPTPTVQGFGP